VPMMFRIRFHLVLSSMELALYPNYIVVEKNLGSLLERIEDTIQLLNSKYLDNIPDIDRTSRNKRTSTLISD